VYFVVNPASALLNSKSPPFTFRKESIARHAFVDLPWELDMAVFVGVILVPLAVVDFRGEVRHLIFLAKVVSNCFPPQFKRQSSACTASQTS
jgi:hypothetical protein